MNSNDLKPYDIITFNDDEKVLVLTTFSFENNEYVYVNKILPDESDVTDAYNVYRIHSKENELESIKDVNLLKKMKPVWNKELKAVIKASGVHKTVGESRKISFSYNLYDSFVEDDGKKYSLNDYENMVQSAYQSKNIGELIEHSIKLKDAGYNDSPSTLSMAVDYTMMCWMEFLNKKGSVWAKERLCIHYGVIHDYDMVSWTIECFVKGLEEREQFIEPSLYYQIGYYKYLQIDDELPMDTMYEKYGGKIVSTGHWYKKAVDAGHPIDEITDGRWCIDYYISWKTNLDKKNSKTKTQNWFDKILSLAGIR